MDSGSLKPHLPKASMKAHSSHPTKHGKGEGMRPSDREGTKSSTKMEKGGACPDCGMKPCKC